MRQHICDKQLGQAAYKRRPFCGYAVHRIERETSRTRRPCQAYSHTASSCGQGLQIQRLQSAPERCRPLTVAQSSAEGSEVTPGVRHQRQVDCACDCPINRAVDLSVIDASASAQSSDIEKALRAASAAAEQAENGLQSVQDLPSSVLPREVLPLWKVLRVALSAILATAAMSASHAFGWWLRIGFGCFTGSCLGLYGYRKGSLSTSGCIAGALVGSITLSSSVRAAVVLTTFYLSSSKLTTYCEDRKSDDESFKKGGQRDWKQVFCNGFVPTLLALAAAYVTGGADLPLFGTTAKQRLYTALAAGFLGYYSCCCGDTWASEVGQLSEDQPRLITSLRPVRKGTNGGVTRLGLLASAAGGLCMGFTFYLAGLVGPVVAQDSLLYQQALQQVTLIPLGLAGGLVGSLVDSVLGATVQFTGYNRQTNKLTSKKGAEVTKISGLSLLSNNAVNFVSASLVAAASAAISVTLLA